MFTLLRELANHPTHPVWLITLMVIDIALAISSTFHAVLHKRETRTVIGWVGLIWLSPIVGSGLYWLFGVNRIERRGHKIVDEIRQTTTRTMRPVSHDEDHSVATFLFDRRLESIGKRVTGRDLLPGNQVIPLIGGEVAFPTMISAIEQAEKTIALCSYIFDYDQAGTLFIEKLVAAQERGVQVRVLVDHVGSRYSKPTSVKMMRQRGLKAATFLPTYLPRLASYANLRNHRKILVVDGITGFTGGMNIREGCLNRPECQHTIQDIQFRFDGPVVDHLLEAFLADWEFATNEQLPYDEWFGVPQRSGSIWARGIPDGPDADFDHIRLVMLGAIAVAQERIDICTPYFLPDSALVGALSVAALRGVQVRILVPSVVNIRVVQWASMEPIQRVLERGCSVYQTPQPFDHTKLMLVDNDWTLVGSSNWDPRSLRLNFEFNVECYGRELNEQLSQLVDAKLALSTPITLTSLENRSLKEKLRDGVARLATPYL